jgi:hypothetical protein
MSNSHPDPLVRQHTNDIELGVSDVLQRHVTRHVVAPKPVSQRKLDFEHKRPRILREMMAEAYVIPQALDLSQMASEATTILT